MCVTGFKVKTHGSFLDGSGSVNWGRPSLSTICRFVAPPERDEDEVGDGGGGDVEVGVEVVPLLELVASVDNSLRDMSKLGSKQGRGISGLNEKRERLWGKNANEVHLKIKYHYYSQAISMSLTQGLNNLRKQQLEK